jgi:hypothetical protein
MNQHARSNNIEKDGEDGLMSPCGTTRPRQTQLLERTSWLTTYDWLVFALS